MANLGPRPFLTPPEISKDRDRHVVYNTKEESFVTYQPGSYQPGWYCKQKIFKSFTLHSQLHPKM